MTDTELKRLRSNNGCYAQCCAVINDKRCTETAKWRRLEKIDSPDLKQVIICLCEKHAKDANWPIGGIGEDND